MLCASPGACAWGRSVDGSLCIRQRSKPWWPADIGARGDFALVLSIIVATFIAAAQMPVVRDLYSRTVGVTPQILSTAIISSMANYIGEQLTGARTCLRRHGEGGERGYPLRDGRTSLAWFRAYAQFSGPDPAQCQLAEFAMWGRS